MPWALKYPLRNARCSLRFIRRFLNAQRGSWWIRFFTWVGLWRSIIFRTRHNFHGTAILMHPWPLVSGGSSSLDWSWDFKFIFWLCSKGFVSTAGPCAMNFEASSILGHKNWTWSMLSLICCMRLFPMLHIPVSTPKSNLDHMPMALWVVQVRNLQIRVQNKLVNCQSTNLLQDKLQLYLNPPKWWMYFLCNRQTRRVTSSPDGIEKRVRIIIKRVGIRMRLLPIMTRMVRMLVGTRKKNVRLSSLVSYVRMITSLTCAPELMKLWDS